MNQPRVMVGMISGGDCAATTSYCFFHLGRQTDWTLQPPVIGSLLQVNLALLTHQFLESKCDLLLRIDSDTVWDAGWVDHFVRQLRRTWKKNREVAPWIHGGVLVKRRRLHNYAPAISVDQELLHDNATYCDWIYEAYVKGATVEVDRTGGAWTVYSRGLMEKIGPRGWDIVWGDPALAPHAHVSEDYSVCDRCRAAGGKVYATFPMKAAAEINHWNGTEPLGLVDFLERASAGGVPLGFQKATAKRLVRDMEIR